MVLLAHYAGWPRAAKLNQTVEELVARRAKTEAERSAEAEDGTGA